MKLAELAKSLLGSQVTWAELLPLIEEAESVHVCFVAETTDGSRTGRAIEIPKDVARNRAVRGVKSSGAAETVNAYAAGGSLFFGGR